MTESQEFTSPISETKPLSSGSMFVKIFSEPSAVFKSIKALPKWALPLIIIIIVSLAAGYVSGPYQVDAQIQAIQQDPDMSDEVRNARLDQLEQAKQVPVISSVFAGVGQSIGTAIMLLISAALFLLMGNVILGGSTRYVTLFSAVSWGSLPMMLGAVVKIPLMMAKESADVRTSLALLFPDKSLFDPVVAALNGLTDIFVIWTIVIEIIGISIIYQFSKGKAATVVLVPYLILLLIGIGISQLFT